MSNVYSHLESDRVYSEAARAVASVSPYLAIVGYETGHDLARARLAGFAPVGHLRILVSGASGT
jgi:hypothetical protein